jgi:hypothetical protein
MPNLRVSDLPALCFALLAACVGGQTGSEGAKGTRGVHNVGDPCSQDRDCEQQLATALKALATARAPVATRLLGASCDPVPAGCASPQARYCHCSYAPEPFDKPLTLDLGANTGCALYSRSLACLEAAGDFAGCERAACSCVETCQDALDRMRDDDARSFAVEARHAVCEHETCRFVLRIDDRCYAGAWPEAWSATYDCALSDQALLAADAAACGNGGCSAPSVATGSICIRDPGVIGVGGDGGLAACSGGGAGGSAP